MMLSVDPGISGTGVALWSVGQANPAIALNVYSKKKKWEEKSLDIATEISNIAIYTVDHIYIEWPEFRRDAVGTASVVEGNLFKLAYLIGQIVAQFPESEVHTVPVSLWKGQLPKEICATRIRKMLPELDPAIKSHAMDAVGIGLYARGFRQW